MACGRDPSAEARPERGAWGAQRRGLQLCVPGGGGLELVCLCVRSTAALRGQLHPGLCDQVRGVRAHTEGGFGITLLTGGVAAPPPKAKGTNKTPAASCRWIPQGLRRRLWPPRLWGYRFPPRASLPIDHVGCPSCPSASKHPAPALCPALCTLTRGSGLGCSDQLREEH